MTFTHALSTNNYGSSKFIVDTSVANGTHTTIAAALTSASSGDTILIRPGTYTENLTLKAGVNLTAYPCDASIGFTSTQFNVKIIGKLTATFAGQCSISNICIQTNSDYCIEITGTSATLVTLNTCYLNATNANAVHMTSNGSAILTLNYSLINMSFATGLYYVITSGSALRLFYSQLFSSAVPGISTLTSGGLLQAEWSLIETGTSADTGTISATHCRFEAGGSINQPVLTSATSGGSEFRNCILVSDTASALSIGTGTTISIYNSTVSSGNTNAITGAGTVSYSGLVFYGNSSIINTTTQIQTFMNLGKYKATGQPAFSAYLTNNITNTTGDATIYTILFDTTSLNVGTCYATGTGLFTAPVAGNYLFTFTIFIQTSSTWNNVFNTYFTVNGAASYKGLFQTGTQNTAQQMNSSILIPLAANDTVGVQVAASTTAGTKNTTLSGSATARSCTFTGHLVS